MFKNIFRHIKSGMSLIELLVVITIIGILIGVLVPTIGNTQAKTRDITRQTQVQELAAALMAYKLDYGEFPTVISEFSLNGNPSSNPYRGDISQLTDLREGGYIKKIPTDPSNMSISIGTDILDTPPLSYTSSGYYLYVSDGKNFAIVAPMEDEKNGNTKGNIPGMLNRLKIVDESNFRQIFTDTFINITSNTGSMYIYAYLDEVL